MGNKKKKKNLSENSRRSIEKERVGYIFHLAVRLQNVPQQLIQISMGKNYLNTKLCALYTDRDYNI